MSARAFDEVTIPYGDKETGAMRITCAHCGAVAYFPHLTGVNRKPPSMAAKHFAGGGWAVGSSPKQDFCPLHVSPAKRKGEKAAAADGGKVDAATAPAVNPPAEMSREDRRIIFAKLNEVYGDGGYVAPWTDAALGKDLGVSPAWVRDIRAEFFGPEGSNPQYDACIAACDAAEAAHASLQRAQADLFREAARRADAARAEIAKWYEATAEEGRAEFATAKAAIEEVRRTRAAIREEIGK